MNCIYYHNECEPSFPKGNEICYNHKYSVEYILDDKNKMYNLVYFDANVNGNCYQIIILPYANTTQIYHYDTNDFILVSDKMIYISPETAEEFLSKFLLL